MKVFVYGTLKLGGMFSEKFLPLRISSERATLENFAMFSIRGYYPGIVFSEGGVVHGEVHEYQHGEAVLAEMDRIEGCGGKNKKDNLYNRYPQTVKLNYGKEVIAQVYIFNGSVAGFKKIESGEWKI